MPNDMTTHKLHKDETVALYVQKMVSLRWQGHKLFCLFVHSLLQSSCDKHGQKEGEKKQGDVSVKPEVVIVYNRRMEGVDKMYQQLASFLILMRHCVKAYKVLLF
jgi:ubiquitin C-terminal hydrolase